MGDKPSSLNKSRDGETNENEKGHKLGSASPTSSPTDREVEAAAETGGRAKAKAAEAEEEEGGHGGTRAAKTVTLPSVTVDPPPGEEHRSPTKGSSPQATPRRASAAVDKGGAKGKAPPHSKKTQQGRAASAGASKQQQQQQRRLSRKKQKRTSVKGDVAPAPPNQRLEFPTTPEMILAIHKRRPFLDKNEEWLVVELNEYECLVENLDIIRTIANHSKFFEVEPDELWEEFFEYVEEMPSYDEVINYDVWQEFRDERYPC